MFWYAVEANSPLAASAAVLFAIVNGLNLLPIVPLDGGVVFRSLLGSIHPALGPIVSWLGVAILIAAAIYLKSVLMGLVVLFAVWQVTVWTSLNMDGQRKRLSVLQGLAVFRWPHLVSRRLRLVDCLLRSPEVSTAFIRKARRIAPAGQTSLN